MILYFSGTGNSRYLAELLSRLTEDELYSMNDGIKHGSVPDISGHKRLIFVVPTYAWRVPRVVTEWMKQRLQCRGQKTYFILTCGDDSGNASKYAAALCQEIGLWYMGMVEIKMPENYIAMFNVPSEAAADRIIKNAESAIKDVADMIMSGMTAPHKRITLSDRIKSGIVNDGFFAFAVKSANFTTTDACTGCDKCEELCPLNNIAIKDGKPVWGGKCTHCMACICRCPAEAIEYGSKSKGKRRYICPR